MGLFSDAGHIDMFQRIITSEGSHNGDDDFKQAR
jgi:hypothetical protein